MVIIDFAVMQFTQQPDIDDRLRRDQLTRIAAFETHARFHPRCLHGRADPVGVSQRQRDRLLDDEVLARFSRRDDLIGVLIRVTAHRDHLQTRVCQHGVQIGVTGNLAAMLRAERRRILRS